MGFFWGIFLSYKPMGLWMGGLNYGEIWYKVIENTQLWLFCTFSYLLPQSGLKRFGMPNFDHFTLFQIFFHQSGQK